VIALGPTTTLLGTTYTAAAVQTLLQGPSLRVRWFFDLLSPQLAYKADLTPLVRWDQPPKISHDSTQAVKRSLAFTMRSSSTVNVLQDLVRVHFGLQAPDGSWLDWVVGTFMFTPPAKEIHEGYTWWTVAAPDLSQLLSDAGFRASTSVQGSSNYVGAIASLAASYGGLTTLSSLIVDQGKLLPAPLVWNAGDSYLKAINDLLGAMVYTPVWVRGTTLLSGPQQDYTQVTPVLTVDTIAGQGQILGPLQDVPDYTGAYNQFLVTGQDPRRQAIAAPLYENIRADSPVSLLNWHPRMHPVINDSTLIDIAACRARARVEAQASARIYSNLTVGIPVFPFFEDLDVITLTYSASDEGIVRANYIVLKTVHTCAPATPTTLVLQRVVSA
jgi:hypothetical protein